MGMAGREAGRRKDERVREHSNGCTEWPLNQRCRQSSNWTGLDSIICELNTHYAEIIGGAIVILSSPFYTVYHSKKSNIGIVTSWMLLISLAFAYIWIALLQPLHPLPSVPSDWHNAERARLHSSPFRNKQTSSCFCLSQTKHSHCLRLLDQFIWTTASSLHSSYRADPAAHSISPHSHSSIRKRNAWVNPKEMMNPLK